MDGFLELQSANDLMAKLRHDFTLLERQPMDTYLAFNFFVTAEHMADWQLPGQSNRTSRADLRKSNTLLQLCSHLANGMKHFRAEAKHHTSVRGALKNRGVYGNSYPNTYQNAHPREILIQLDGDAREAYGDSINVVDLARETLEFWEAVLDGEADAQTPKE